MKATHLAAASVAALLYASLATPASAIAETSTRQAPTTVGQAIPGQSRTGSGLVPNTIVRPAAVCNPAHANQHDTGGGFAYQGVNIRTGPGTNCTSLGLGYTNHAVTYHCYTDGDWVTVGGITFTTWTYLTDNSTGVSGWSSDGFLTGYGSFTHC